MKNMKQFEWPSWDEQTPPPSQARLLLGSPQKQHRSCTDRGRGEEGKEKHRAENGDPFPSDPI